MNKRRRAAFNLLVAHAHALIGLQAAIGFWVTAQTRGALRHMHGVAMATSRKLRLLRSALSHHASVLLQVGALPMKRAVALALADMTRAPR